MRSTLFSPVRQSTAEINQSTKSINNVINETLLITYLSAEGTENIKLSDRTTINEKIFQIFFFF